MQQGGDATKVWQYHCRTDSHDILNMQPFEGDKQFEQDGPHVRQLDATTVNGATVSKDQSQPEGKMINAKTEEVVSQVKGRYDSDISDGCRTSVDDTIAKDEDESNGKVCRTVLTKVEVSGQHDSRGDEISGKNETSVNDTIKREQGRKDSVLRRPTGQIIEQRTEDKSSRKGPDLRATGKVLC